MKINRFKILLITIVALLPVRMMADKADDEEIKDCCMSMLARFTEYAQSIYTDGAKNSEGTATGFFKANSAGQSNEDGVRTNADMAMICAFVYQYGQRHEAILPEGVTYRNLRKMAINAIRYAYSTHKANRLLTCSDGKYWGTVWESSLWNESIAIASFLLKDELTKKDWEWIEKEIVMEADYDLGRTVPTGYKGDTKAEENGWETNVLAAACSLFPRHERASAWYNKMREFAFNCYTIGADSISTVPVDGIEARKWYRGQNLYDDFTLQNHNYFHTSYQNVVIQELCESIIILKLFGGHFPVSETLYWHQQDVFDKVLKYLALPDGELAMPNGNDWSMLLYDQLPAYASMATIFKDADALMLEKEALRNTGKRQQTTTDGAWMLNADIGHRRMGVTGHRVMMTYLLHDIFGTDSIKATRWRDFAWKYRGSKLFSSQNIMRMMTPRYFFCFSSSEGLKNNSGIFIPFLRDNENILLPYKKNGTGSLMGYINDKKMKQRKDTEFNTENSTVKLFLISEDETLQQDVTITRSGEFAISVQIATTALEDITIDSNKTGLVALSLDPFTREKRAIYYEINGQITCDSIDGNDLKTMQSKWINIDDELGVIDISADSHYKKSRKEKYKNVIQHDSYGMAIGEKELVNSIGTAKIYPFFGSKGISLKKNDTMLNAFTIVSQQKAKVTKLTSNLHTEGLGKIDFK